MNLMNDNLNITKMYKYQLEDLNSEDYQKYIKYLELFFTKEHKKEKYTKEILNGQYILINKNDPSKKIVITPAEFINIHKLYIELKEYSELILFKISTIIESKNNITDENRTEFENLKKRYVLYRDQLKNINSINKDFYNEMKILLNKKIDKSNELAKYYQKRNYDYSNIQMMIPEKLKSNLIKVFKENNKKIPSTAQINKIAKENVIPSNEIENWFIWIETVYFYRLIKDEILIIDNEIKIKEEKFDINTKYMIIKKPDIKNNI